jgi:hypothetical protein
MILVIFAGSDDIKLFFNQLLEPFRVVEIQVSP